MEAFAYRAVRDEGEALQALAEPGARFLAGGTTLLDLMKLGVETPSRIVDLNRLPLDQIAELPGGGLRIGAMARNSDLAHDEKVRSRYPLLSQALLAGASPQLRNMATTAGNLMQRTRCPYFRDTATRCNKRRPGSGCDALEGVNRGHAILGTSESCIATHPSDLCVALAALDAVVRVRGRGSERTIPFADFHLLPGDHPERETALRSDELIVAVDVPRLDFARRSLYLKVRDRASYSFALASVAVALDLEGGRMISEARVALGGVGTRPWRSREAERALAGKAPGAAAYRAAAEAALADARPHRHNAFKVELAKRTLVRALERVAGLA
jgi:xanthine dehydrogenase YagS FAD-binding subunit